jgi:hypothetical protein
VTAQRNQASSLTSLPVRLFSFDLKDKLDFEFSYFSRYVLLKSEFLWHFGVPWSLSPSLFYSKASLAFLSGLVLYSKL